MNDRRNIWLILDRDGYCVGVVDVSREPQANAIEEMCKKRDLLNPRCGPHRFVSGDFEPKPKAEHKNEGCPLQCPKCGNRDLDTMRYLEDIPVEREVLAWQSDTETLYLEDKGKAWWDFTENERWSCGKCSAEFTNAEIKISFEKPPA